MTPLTFATRGCAGDEPHLTKFRPSGSWRGRRCEPVRTSPVSSARAAAIVTGGYALGFGLAAVPVSIYLLRNGQLPTFFGLFEMFAGPWSASTSDSTFVGLLLLFCTATLVAAYSAGLLWQGRRIGAVLNLAVLPVEAVFWIGFALPLPWVTGLARVVLLGVAWNSLSRSGHQAELAPP